MVEKEVLALLRILDSGYTMFVAREIKVLHVIQRWPGWYNLQALMGGWGDGRRCYKIGRWRSRSVKRNNMKFLVRLPPALLCAK